MLDNTRNVVIRNLPPSGERSPLFIVGDIHGCAKELSEILKRARQRIPDCQILLVGDLFTKGPDPVGVFELIHEYGATAIKGNHDWALISAILQAQRRGVDSLHEHTRQTLHLIRYHRRAIFSYLSNLAHGYVSTVVPNRRRPSWETEYPLIVVHAGIDPIAGLMQTAERTLLTARWFRWEGEGEGRKPVLVHSTARHEIQGPHAYTAMDKNIEKFRWHEIHKGPELIVFGHDAKQGLFRKTLPTGRPICVGLDTGCTYGRSLTGYFPEFDDAIHVDSARTYFDLSKNVILLRAPQYKMIEGDAS